MAELTPMMKQYLEIKKDNPDSILFFRLGDFYEMFADDAKLASKELDLTLTSRDHGKNAKPEEERVPMCGIPYHASESYIARLIAKGYKVAICEQMEDPATAKGLVKRDIIRVVTPGTVSTPHVWMISPATTSAAFIWTVREAARPSATSPPVRLTSPPSQVKTP